MHNSIPTGIIASAALVPTFKLEQNYPNPFNPHTKIQFTLPKAATVSLGIYDLNGRIVKHLISGEQHGNGTHSVAWDGTNDNGEKVSSGIYFSRLQAGEYVASTKMSLVK
jgi:flagellar hook assembly protein FlgD